EGHGLPQSVIEASSSAVVIPMSARAESLNAAAAAAILLWELRA
ncbi:MAG: RNA methyltransferase, partial [Oscillospiraceae bacterium]|nr:RNA methyltransferase [Oscillospiraceae bacterium]